ncbi:DNA polymerase ligase N-terminal domain-containing protein [Actinomadura sp. DC4]|uniref:DNA polymerase ligase N-terminal domain-containing protein n=1 Tax=Actinomadura sp. DC4 TaxID=3055069 RepID=UPI0025B00786|nr:DNA polymerase ligase N-terminal domain-containing protein [Actinomadura sp. DC4]MDN3353293.1 DNA polymerase ligase N-terminal domain-containing protein [Actinomadura sp. DC4]
MADRLGTYRSKRDARRTPEPVPREGPLPEGRDDTFVIQEHHARRLHWDFRLERDGVLVSWALPKGVPDDPKTNHLAVHTEDHPLEYAAFAGEIPQGEYGGGQVKIWDRGTYETEKWAEREIKIVLHGGRVSGRYVLFPTKGKNWMIHRMDPPVSPDAEPMPGDVRPVLPEERRRLPRNKEEYGYEFAWGGRRMIMYADRGPARPVAADGRPAKAPRGLGEALGSRRAVLDGEMTDAGGETYMIFDLLYLDGRTLFDEPYERRRELLEELGLSGPRWQTAPVFDDGDAVRETAREQGLPGILAKRLDAPYRQAKADWRLIPV